MKILVTGATGNVGKATLWALTQKDDKNLELFAASRHKNNLKGSNNVKEVYFDFADPGSYRDHLGNYDTILLLRPPQLADAKKFFEPFVNSLKPNQHVVFLSVQGADKMSWVPHHKIEKLFLSSSTPYTFLRPSYFMQNFEGDLREDLLKRHQVFLPAGKSKFNLIDVKDIGEVAAKILVDPASHHQQAYELTGNENLTFGEMAAIISQVSDTKVIYKSPGIIKFFITKKRQGISSGKIMVMIILHYLPRLSKKEPAKTAWVKKITGKEPEQFSTYVNITLAKLL
jgi:uncharacterized protein YbjT (DUF2867 family)